MAPSSNPFARAVFRVAARGRSAFPAEELAEVAFVGRSNAGKSSAINALAGRRDLARTSKAPGRTRAVHFYEVRGLGRLVDLPGYGYAAAPRAERVAWERLARDYLHGRPLLAAIVLVLDARRGLRPLDEELLAYVAPLGRPRLVLLAKSDQLARHEVIAAKAEVERRIAPAPGELVLAFSSRSGTGVEEARDWLEGILRAGPVGAKKTPGQGEETGGGTP